MWEYCVKYRAFHYDEVPDDSYSVRFVLFTYIIQMQGYLLVTVEFLMRF